MSTKTVLIIDDSPEDRQVYRRYLQQDPDYQYIILEAESAQAGISQCDRTQIDGILLDFLLPDGNGLEFLANLKQFYGEIIPPVIMVTGYGNEAIAVQAMKQGAQDYLVKGKTTAASLQAAVHSAIEMSQLRHNLQHALSCQQQAEAEAAQYQALLQQILDTNPGIVYLYDPTEQHCIYLNPQASQYLGYSVKQVMAMGKDFITRVMHPDDQERLVSHFQQLDRSIDQEVREIEYRMRHTNGEWRWFLSRDRVFSRTEGGKLSQIIGTAQDITTRKQTEARLQRLLQLEHTAREQAEAANRSKDEFMAIVSHELRSPLNSILGWAKLLRTQSLEPATIERALEVIERNAQAQSQLIEDLLDISRIIRGTLRLELTPTQLDRVIGTAIDVVSPMAAAKQIQIQTEIHPVDPVYGDFNRLQQVVWNLLTNAIKFTPSGGRINIRLRFLSPAELLHLPASDCCSSSPEIADVPPVTTYAEITITDTGKGIQPQFLREIFDRFRQVEGSNPDSSNPDAKGGLGLGLAIVRQLVRLHHGVVWAESEGEGRGTTFRVVLPCQKQE